MTGRRLSSNVDDRRGSSGTRVAGIGGVAGVIIAVVVTLLSGGDLTDVARNLGMMDTSSIVSSDPNYTPTEHEQELATFASQVLAGTEDVWTAEFKKMGLTYEPPKLVMFTGSVQSGCGGATSQTGPFYCSADQTVYIDLSFFEEMENQMRAGGDFAYAYVIAHEVGHHVQYLLGDLQEAHAKMAKLSSSEANKISVRIELQADFYAGVWAYHDNEMFGSLEDGDIEEGLNAASKIGDDYLQKQAQGYAVPETFNHGRSDQRVKWLKLGATTGDVNRGDTFSPAYDSL
jgi:predicted metalloprotease